MTMACVRITSRRRLQMQAQEKQLVSIIIQPCPRQCLYRLTSQGGLANVRASPRENLQLDWEPKSKEDFLNSSAPRRPGHQATAPTSLPPKTGEGVLCRPVGFPGLMMQSTLGSQWSLASRTARRSSFTFRAQQLSSSR